ncbi:MAG: ADP-ribose diphosphatase [Rhodospirillales bacterium]
MAQQDEKDDLEILGTERLYDGFTQLVRSTARHRKRDGTWSRSYQREVLLPGLAVAVLPYDPELDRVVLIEQQRVPAWYAGLPTRMVETVAGLAKPDEAPEEVARRELQEEAGVVARDMVEVADFLPSPGSTAARLKLFYATVDASEAGGWFGLEEEDEEVRAFPATVQEIAELVESGKIHNGTTLIALQWFLLNHKSLQAKRLPQALAAP